MSDASETQVGRVAALWRYPVKSMKGEDLDAVDVTPSGLLGDRAFALIDVETGCAASAKNQRRWPSLLDMKADFLHDPAQNAPPPPVRVTLPDGATFTSTEPDFDARMSEVLARPVRLARSSTPGVMAQGYWPEHDWLPGAGTEFEFPLFPGTFFDGAPIHIVTTATLLHLAETSPESDFSSPRFRPNFILDTSESLHGFVEDGWLGRRLQLGEVVLRVDRPTPRCVMTTLPQSGLRHDPGVLRTAVRSNGSNVGVYATLVQSGRVFRGDAVRLLDD